MLAQYAFRLCSTGNSEICIYTLETYQNGKLTFFRRYMMGLGVGSVIVSPTAILWGKRPVYLVSAIIFIATSIWCATSPSYNSLLVARIFQGISVSPVECLPSATIAEIFFLHERAYRIGIYTLLLLGGKNLVPLVSAAIIQSLSWRWVFWYVFSLVVRYEQSTTNLRQDRCYGSRVLWLSPLPLRTRIFLG